MQHIRHQLSISGRRARAGLLALVCAAMGAFDGSSADVQDGAAPAALAEAGTPGAIATPGSNLTDAAAGSDVPPGTEEASVLGDSQQSAPGTATEIVAHAQWARVDPMLDPFLDRPASVTCDASATLPELFGGVSAYGIDTGSCNYATVQQPTAHSIAAGDVITVRLAHFQLTASEDSSAHVAVRVEDLAILDEHIPIPSDSQVLVRTLVAPRAIAAGANVYFHVHNHGANSYALISVSRRR